EVVQVEVRKLRKAIRQHEGKERVFALGGGSSKCSADCLDSGATRILAFPRYFLGDVMSDKASSSNIQCEPLSYIVRDIYSVQSCEDVDGGPFDEGLGRHQAC